MNRSALPNEIAPRAAEWTCEAKLDTEIGEGPVYSVKEACLYFVDIPAGRIHRHVSGEPIETFELGQPVTAVVPRAAGGLLAALERGLAFVDLSTGGIQEVVHMSGEPNGNRFNDGKCDRRGRFWAGTMGKEAWSAPIGTLYRIGAEMRPESMIPEIRCSNGLGWSPDNQTLYYTESFAHTIWAFDFELESGSISGRRVFAQLDPAAGAFPDGLAVDAEGGVWSAQPVYGRLVRYDPEGRIERILDTPVSRPTSLAFGGEDMATLYVTTALELAFTRSERARASRWLASVGSSGSERGARGSFRGVVCAGFGHLGAAKFASRKILGTEFCANRKFKYYFCFYWHFLLLDRCKKQLLFLFACCMFSVAGGRDCRRTPSGRSSIMEYFRMGGASFGAITAAALTFAAMGGLARADDVVDKAKADVSKATGLQTEWNGPTSAPKVTPGKKIIYLSGDEQIDTSHEYGVYMKEAAEKIGWEATVIDGKGSPTSWLAAFNQAIALKPDGIAIFADAASLQDPIKAANAQGIKIIGLHATALPGPYPDLGVFFNIQGDPRNVGRIQGEWAIADSRRQGARGHPHAQRVQDRRDEVDSHQDGGRDV